MEKPSIDTPLVRHVLECVESVEGSRKTAQEIKTMYEKRNPPLSWMRSASGALVSLENIEWALKFLAEAKYIQRELTRFYDFERGDSEMKEDTWMYFKKKKEIPPPPRKK
ncbi:MAG: hypothetical protein WC444_00745 [Candidatus Paceibacterota bacterium]